MSVERTRVLVVDDEPGMREGCRKILESEGYLVETAEDGLQGLDLFERHGDFEIVLADLNMPRMGGLELIRKLREIDPDVIIFVITAYATIETAVQATQSGAYGYIPKPFTPDELLMPLQHGLEKRALTIEARRLREERERRLLEVALERSKSRTIISCMTDGVLVVNRDRQMVLRNAAMMQIMPQCTAVPLSLPIDQLGCSDLGAVLDEVLSGATGPTIASRELVLDGGVYMANVSPVLEPSGETTGAVVVLRDITALKKLDEAKSMFISMVAHEVKSPLAAVENYLTVILNGLVDSNPAKKRQMLERCLLRLGALRTMVSELINITAIETGKFTIRRSPVDVREVVGAALDACKDRAEGKETALFLDAAPDVDEVKVMADRDSLLIILTNLIDNAIKYTPAHGHVNVSLSQDGVFVRMAVKDNGVGMTPEDKARVFDEFFRAKNSFTAEVPGTGLGLSLVKKLVEMHQGSVAVESRPGEGSTFAVNLPIAE